MNIKELNEIAPIHATTKQGLEIRLSDTRLEEDLPSYCAYCHNEGLFLGIDRALSRNPQWFNTILDCEAIINDYVKNTHFIRERTHSVDPKTGKIIDPVKQPTHYKSHPSGVECIQITEHMGFSLGCALKYIWRADEKGNAIEDLKKAVWYLNREISRRENTNQ